MKSQMQSPKPSFPRPRPRARSSAKASKTRTTTINSSPSSSSSVSCSSGSSAGSGSVSHIETIAYAGTGTGTDVGGGTSNSNPSARLKNGNDSKVLQVQVHVDSSSHNKDGTVTTKQMKRRSRSKSKAKNMNTPMVASKSKVESESPPSSSPINSPPMAFVDEHRDCSPTTMPMDENTENAMEKAHVTSQSQSQTQHVKRSHTRKQMRKNKSKSQHQNQHSNQKSKKGQGLGQEQGVEQDDVMRELVPVAAVESESVSQPPESRPTHSKSDTVSKRGQSHHQHGKKYSRQGKQYHKRHGNGNTNGNDNGNDIDNLRKETRNIPGNSPTDKSPAQDEHLDNHHVNVHKQNRRTGKKSKSQQQQHQHHRRSSSPKDVNVSLDDDGEGHGTCTMNANDAANDLSIPKLDARSDASKSTMVVVPPPLFSPMQTRKVTDESSHVQQAEEATEKEQEGDEQKKEFHHTAQRTTDHEERGSSTGGSASAVNKTGSETVVTTNAAGLALLHRLSGNGTFQPSNRNQGHSHATVVDVQHDRVIADATTRSAATSNLNDSMSSSASGGVGASMEVHASASPMHARDEEFEGGSFVGWKNGEEEQNFVSEDVNVEEYVDSTNPSMMYCEASEMPMPYMMHSQTMMNTYGPPHPGHPPIQPQQGWMNANVNPHLIAPTMQAHTVPAPVADGGSVGSEGHGQELHMSPPSYPYEHMDMTAIPQPQQPMYMTNSNYPVMIGNPQGQYVDGNGIPSYPPISPHHVGYGMNEPCPMPYGAAVPDAMQQQQPPLLPSSQPLQPIVPLKYEQVTIGGCMYFNPVYIADAEDLAPDDQDVSDGDVDKENQAVDVNVSKNVGASKKKGKANSTVTKQKNTRPTNKKVKRGGKGRNKGRFNKSHQNNDKRVATATPS